MSKDIERKEKTVEERARKEAIIYLRIPMLIAVIGTSIMIIISITSNSSIAVKVFMVFMCIACFVFVKMLIKKGYDLEYEQIKAREYVKDNLLQPYVRIEPKADSEFILNLKTKAKFYAQYNEEKEIVLISVKYNGEEQYIPFEKLWPLEFTEKYQIAGIL